MNYFLENCESNDLCVGLKQERDGGALLTWFWGGRSTRYRCHINHIAVCDWFFIVLRIESRGARRLSSAEPTPWGRASSGAAAASARVPGANGSREQVSMRGLIKGNRLRSKQMKCCLLITEAAKRGLSAHAIAQLPSIILGENLFTHQPKSSFRVNRRRIRFLPTVRVARHAKAIII